MTVPLPIYSPDQAKCLLIALVCQCHDWLYYHDRKGSPHTGFKDYRLFININQRPTKPQTGRRVEERALNQTESLNGTSTGYRDSLSPPPHCPAKETGRGQANASCLSTQSQRSCTSCCTRVSLAWRRPSYRLSWRVSGAEAVAIGTAYRRAARMRATTLQRIEPRGCYDDCT